MGGERARKGKRFFLCLACLITILPVFAGCISYLDKSKGDASLATAKSLLSQGKYVASLKESKEILARYPETHGDQALLLMGLICAHPRNPNVSYKKSLQYFDRLIREFPLSRLTDEAGIWILTTRKLQSNEREIQALKKQSTRNEEALTVRQKQIKMLQGQIGRLRTHLTDLQEEKKTLYLQIKNLNDQMKRLKEIDLKIEEQKRGTFDR